MEERVSLEEERGEASVGAAAGRVEPDDLLAVAEGLGEASKPGPILPRQIGGGRRKEIDLRSGHRGCWVFVLVARAPSFSGKTPGKRSIQSKEFVGGGVSNGGELESLELDMKSLRKERVEDRKEFHQFQATVNKNFTTMQKNFDKIQDNFRRLLLDPDPGKDDAADHVSVQGAVVQKDNHGGSPMIAPGRPKQLVVDTPPYVTMPEKAVVGVVGTTVLRDQAGRELNMDGTLKQPYRHPNFGINKAQGMGQNVIAGQAVQGEELQEIDGYDNNYRRRVTTPMDTNTKVKVVVASGEVPWNEFTVKNCPYEIQGNAFCDSFRILKLTGYDMILGVDWLKKYSPVQMDFYQDGAENCRHTRSSDYICG
ncbi:hypothetical protein D1007_47412 [Hordeum vulgare]|nr:hypothetical protein D1007_47412 [Hordeum vulgare]